VTCGDSENKDSVAAFWKGLKVRFDERKSMSKLVHISCAAIFWEGEFGGRADSEGKMSTDVKLPTTMIHGVPDTVHIKISYIIPLSKLSHLLKIFERSLKA